jgi:hypothetical protein
MVQSMSLGLMWPASNFAAIEMAKLPAFSQVLATLSCLFGLVTQSVADQARSDVCDQFDGSRPMVSQTFFMQLEGVRHQLRVPKAYLEDPWDWAQGAEHTAQLFRVTTEGFEPVTRRRSSEMMRAGNRGFYSFIFLDFVPLEELLRLHLHLRLFARDIDGIHPGFNDAPRHFFKEVRGENKLAQLVPLSGVSMFRDIFVARAADGRLTAVFTCTQLGDAISPG